ncbi:MAG TPA: alpha/beta hydrolase [Polyangia bacterium]
MKRLLVTSWLVTSLLVAAGCHGARLDGFLYAPVKTDDYALQTYLAYREITIPSTDGVTLHAMVVQGTQPYTLVYCHGQGGDITDSWPRIELLAPLGYNLVIWDYRGFGRSTGTPSERGIQDDEEALWSALSASLGGNRLVYYGRSFGGAPCIDLATRHAPTALVEESTFTSVDALVADGAYVDLPRSYVADDSWNSLAKMPLLGKVPLLALHGAADDYVQPKYSQQLAAAHPGTTQLVLVPGADHSNVPDKMGFDQYRATVDAFVRAAP